MARRARRDGQSAGDIQHVGVHVDTHDPALWTDDGGDLPGHAARAAGHVEHALTGAASRVSQEQPGERVGMVAPRYCS
jgi:hypothetical protein